MMDCTYKRTLFTFHSASVLIPLLTSSLLASLLLTATSATRVRRHILLKVFLSHRCSSSPLKSYNEERSLRTPLLAFWKFIPAIVKW